MLLPSYITKPNYPATIVDRPRLYRQLNRWQEARAVVVHAPAGYGKSSLVSRWIDISDNAARAAWLSLDETECDPREFVRGVSGALDTTLPGLLTAMQPILDDPQSEPQRAMRRLIARLWDDLMVGGSAPDSHRLLVLEDQHQLLDCETASLLMLLLEKGPPSLHLMLLARDATSPPLPRLYASGQVVELTAADLRFTPDEVREYLLSHRISSSPDELAQIVQRTEGWVAALQLALHSQRGPGSFAEYLGTLHGDTQWLARYLTQEVLAQLSPALRDFLLRTSILESFSAPLAAAVTGFDDTYRLLSELQHKELFLIQVDADGNWQRYHHLFRELLRHRLLVVEGKAAISELHRRAADWLSKQDQLLPAIRHLQDAGDEDGAAALVESRIRPAIQHNPVYALRLFDAVPPDAAGRRPRLMIERCLISLMIANRDLALHVHNAQRSLAECPCTQPQKEELEAELLLYHACLHHAEGALMSAVALAQEALAQSHKLDRLLVGVLEFLWMHLTASTADETIRRGHARRALAAFKSTDFAAGQIAVRRELALMEIGAGRSEKASREFDEIVRRFGNDPATPKAELDWVYMYAAEHSYWQNQLDRALHHIKAAREIASTHEDDEIAFHLPYLHKLYAFRGRRSEAIEEQRSTVDEPPRWYQLADWQIRWLLATDRIDEAWRVAEEYQASLVDDLRNLSYKRAIPYLRAYIARGIDLEDAKPLLSHALEASVSARDYPRQLELLAFRAWQELQTGEEGTARETLSRVEELVVKTGYVRVLLDIPVLAARLTTTERSDDVAVAASQADEKHLLTGQEQAILDLLTNDRTYGQIAEALVISVNTVRTHIRHIYEKLAVHRRDQAIRRAQELGIVS